MNRIARRLVAAALAATAFAVLPAAASASPNREPRMPPPPPHAAGPAAAPAHAPPALAARPHFAERERAARGLRELEAARRHFHAARHSRWEVRRFERWYTARRAELTRRLAFHPAPFRRG